MAAGASPTGLTNAEAARLLAEHGPNELPAPERRNLARIVLEVLSEPMFGLLLAAGAVYFALGDVREAVVLLLFANFSVSIAVVQELRSERVLEALRAIASPRARVLRDGVVVSVAGAEVVPGDLLLLDEGDRVPADACLVQGDGLMADESMLTGESVPVRKQALVEGDDVPVAVPGGDDQPFVYSGTLLVRGGGRALVTATGPRSEVGKIGRSLGTIHPEPPRLQAQTRRLVRIFGIAGALASMLVVALYALLRGSLLQGVLAGIAVGMSLLPEEFPLILTVFLVMGAWRISRARVLTRRGSAIESLGSATVLCTDKTGTLTWNRMAVACLAAPGERGWEHWVAGESTNAPARRVLAAALLASSRDALDPMDRAVHELAPRLLDDAEAWLAAHAVLEDFPVTPELPARTSVCASAVPESSLVVTKGAPEAVVRLCRLPEAAAGTILEEVARMARQGMRVLAVAEATAPSGAVLGSPDQVAFSFLGLAGFRDPLREGVPEAVADCAAAGVRVVMITGDHPETAKVLAREAGIDCTHVVTGGELAALDGPALEARVREACVYARIRPEQKLRIVQALQQAGEVVAMTGDGVNDAPALRAAHIGIAMGSRGTEVAREASSIVLLDDDFPSIVATMRLGRRIYDNLRKAMGYVAALHIPIAGMALLPLLLGMPLVLTPTIVAFLEMIIDPVCSVVFEAEPEEDDVMRRPPRDPRSPLLPSSLLGWALLQGLLAFACVAAVFVLAASAGLSDPEVRTVVFTSLVTTNVALMFTNRSFGGRAVEALRRPNRLLWFAVGGAALMLVVVVQWEPARSLFRLGPMHRHDLVTSLGTAFLLWGTLEILKARWSARLDG